CRKARTWARPPTARSGRASHWRRNPSASTCTRESPPPVESLLQLRGVETVISSGGHVRGDVRTVEQDAVRTIVHTGIERTDLALRREPAGRIATGAVVEIDLRIFRLTDER